jgi:hypothetical protein
MMRLLSDVYLAHTSRITPTQEGMLPIHFAALYNRLDAAALLLDRGSLLNPPAPKKVCCVVLVTWHATWAGSRHTGSHSPSAS